MFKLYLRNVRILKCMEKNFNRVEKKFRLNTEQYEGVMSALEKYMHADSHGLTVITSAYIDDNQRNIIGRSIEKPLYKEKVRIRSYGQPNDADPVFLELKKKMKGVVYKRRVTMSRAAAVMFLLGTPYKDAVLMTPLEDEAKQANCFTKTSLQIADEITAFMERHNWPGMSMIIRSARTAYVPNENIDGMDIGDSFGTDSLRITVDQNLEYCDIQDAGLHYKDEDFCEIIPPTDSIMEIKCGGAIPLWLTKILSDNNVYTSGFSKYGTAYQDAVIYKTRLLKSAKHNKNKEE